MRRGLLTIIGSAFLVLALASCHGTKVDKKPTGGESTTPTETKEPTLFEAPATFDTSKNYEITFWAKNDSNQAQINVYNKAIQDFQTLYPNISVKMVSYTDYKVIYSDVIKRISTNTTPNVSIAYPDHVATYLEGDGIVANLDSLMTNPSYGFGGSDLRFDGPTRSEVYEKYLNEGILKGHYYTLPFMRSSEALYINEDYVKSLGFTIPDIPTWDWMWEVCQAAVDAKKKELEANPNADSVLYPMIYKSADNMFISMLKQKGYDYVSEDEKIKFFDDDRVADLLTDLADKGQKNLFNIFKKVSYPANFFNKWECVMAVDSTAGATWMGCGATTHDAGSSSEGARFETVVRPIPQYDTTNPQMISQGPSICLFNKEDKQEVVASWLFAQYLLTNDVQIGYGKTEGYLPVTSKATASTEYNAYLADSTQYSVKRDAAKLVLDNVDNTFITLAFNGSANIRSAGEDLIYYALNKKYASKEMITTEVYQRVIQNNQLAAYIGSNASNPSSSAVLEDRKLGAPAYILMGVFGGVWMAILAYYLYGLRKKKKRKQ